MRRADCPSGGLPWYGYAALCLLTVATLCLCVSLGSVAVPFGDTVAAVWKALWGMELPQGISRTIILNVRLPRVMATALCGASLALCGAAMQGLLRNPLADGSTLGVSAGASLGAVTALLLGISFPGLPFAGTMVTAMLFALGSLILILSLSYAADRGMSTQTIILMGVVLSMFVTSIISLLTAFSGEKLRSITFWTMGSLSGAGYTEALVLLGALAVFGGVLLSRADELNAFSLGEDAARHMGVAVRPVKLCVLVCVAALIGVCVSVGGSIGFVGLIVPHTARLFAGANHRRVLPLSVFMGAIFLMLADLLARTVVSPIELPIGVVTSLVGSVVFVVLFFRRRRLC